MNRLIVIIAISYSAFANDLPQNPVFDEAQVTIEVNGNTMNIETGYDQTISWEGFDIAPDHQVNIHQPSSDSTSTNIVTGNKMSSIAGGLYSNGEVVLKNHAGIHFVKGSMIDVPTLWLQTGISEASVIIDEGDYRTDILLIDALNIEINSPLDLQMLFLGYDELIEDYEAYFSINAPISVSQMMLTAGDGAVLLDQSIKIRRSHNEMDDYLGILVDAKDIEIKGPIIFQDNGYLSSGIILVGDNVKVDQDNISMPWFKPWGYEKDYFYIMANNVELIGDPSGFKFNILSSSEFDY